LEAKVKKGISLIETLVVVAVLAIVGVLVTSSISLSLQGTKKSTAMVHARENLDYSLRIIERQIRGASSTPTCTGSTAVNYLDQDGKPGLFKCFSGSDSYVASGSANVRLTTNDVKVTACSFTCTPGSGSTPPSVTINLTVQDASATGIEGAAVSASTQINLMNY
jgi:type II secretory pathway pseudopilin PulG